MHFSNRINPGQVTVLALLASLCVFLPFDCPAADAPDAGRLLQDTNKAPELRPRRTIPEIKSPATQPVEELSNIPAIEVTQFNITGNTIISLAELELLLQEHVNKKLSFKQLEQAAYLITELYKKNGYITSYAYLPRQDVNNGIIRIDVIEGKVAQGGIKYKYEENIRLDMSVAQRVLGASIQEGAPLRKGGLERGLILLNEIPGINAKSTIVPGATASTSDLLIEVKEGSLFTGALEVLASPTFGKKPLLEPIG